MLFNIKNFSIDFNRDYGIDKKTGWSININGSFYAQLERFLIVALIKAFYVYWFVIDKEYR